MEKYRVVVRDVEGKVLPGATVTVKDYPSLVTSTVYSANLVDPGNVITDFLTNGKGIFEFYAPDGRYQIDVTYDGDVVDSWVDELIDDPADSSVFVGDHTTGYVRDAVDVEAITKSGGIEERVAALEAEDFLEAAQNLADLDSASTARTNLGLGTVATLDTGTGDGNALTGSNADTRYLVTSSVTYDIGATGDYATLNAAITDLVKKRRGASGETVTLRFETGEAMAEQVTIDGLDLSWITIDGVDADTTITRSALTTMNYGLYYAAFVAANGAKLPHIAQDFTMDTSGTGTFRVGCIVDASYAVISGGFKDCADTNLIVSGGALVNASSADFSNTASSTSVTVGSGSVFNGSSCDVSGSGGLGYGIRISGAAIVNLSSATANNRGTGVEATEASIVDCSQLTAGSCGTGIYASHGAVVNATSANVSSAASYGVEAHVGAQVSGQSINAGSAGTFGFRVANSGIICQGASCTGTLNVTANTITAGSGIIYQ